MEIERVGGKRENECVCMSVCVCVCVSDREREREASNTHTCISSFLQFRGKWYAMRFLLDTPISSEKRAIQFSNNSSSSSEEAAATEPSEHAQEGTRSIPVEGTYDIVKYKLQDKS